MEERISLFSKPLFFHDVKKREKLERVLKQSLIRGFISTYICMYIVHDEKFANLLGYLDVFPHL
jgi:hypothetical protein